MRKRHSEMAAKQASEKAKSPRVFGQATETAENVSRRPLCPRFHQRPTDHPIADPRPARVRRPAGLDHRYASEGGRFRRCATRTAGKVAGRCAPPGDRRRAGVAIGSLGPVGGGPAGDTSGTGASRSRFRIADGGTGSDDTSRSGDGRRYWRYSPSSNGRFCGNGCALAWRMHGRTASDWAGRRPQRSTPAKIRKLHRAGVSKAEIARRLQIGRTSVRRILEAKP